MPFNPEKYNIYNHFEKSFFPNSLPEGAITPSDEGELFLHLPFSDLRGWVYSDSDFYKNYIVFRDQMIRLQDVACLSYIAHVEHHVNPNEQIFYRTNHSRENHTFVVAATGALILEQNNASREDINKYLTAAFLHDMATPALGDATKYIDVKNLHEELFWQNMLGQEQLEFIKNIPATIEEIDSIIKNEGLLGQVLDIADRITYVCQDLANITRQPLKYESKKDIKDNLSKFLLYNPKIGNIYEDVKIENGQVYFSDPEKLYRFLSVRVMLFKDAYMHPINQGRDYIVASKIKPFYKSADNPDGELTPDILRKMNDYSLIDYLAGKNGKDYINFDLELDPWHPQFYEKFKTYDSAFKRKQELEKTSYIKIVGIKECAGCSASTKYKVKDNEGNLITIHDYNPKGSQIIEKIASNLKGFYLYYDRK